MKEWELYCKGNADYPHAAIKKILRRLEMVMEPNEMNVFLLCSLSISSKVCVVCLFLKRL